MADQSNKIDINDVIKKIIEQYKTIRQIKKDELDITKINSFTLFYKLYNLSIKYAIILIKVQELAAAGLKNKTNTEKEIKDILNHYYKRFQHLKEEIDIIKIDLEEKIKNSNFKNQKIIDFKKAVEESEVNDTNFKEYCAKYNYFNRSLVSNYSNNLQLAYDKIIQGNSQIINEYLEIFYDNYIKLMEELDKVKNYKIIKDIDKIKKGLYVKKLKIDELLTNKNFSKKKQANSIKIPNRIINSITNLNKYNLPTLQSNNNQTGYKKLKLPANKKKSKNMNRLTELKLAAQIRSLSNQEQLELKRLLKKQNNNLSKMEKEYSNNNGVGVFGTNPASLSA